jgi:N-acetylneuraminic acid mutarotase
VEDFPVERYGAVAFSIDNIGFVGTGYNGSTLLDFYKYTPGSGWAAIANYPSKVREAVAFVIDNKGYVCTGEKNGEAIDDFHMYDPANDSWTPKRKISNSSDEKFDDDYTIVRQKAVAFVIGGKGYVTTGDFGGLKSDTWEYDVTLDEWTERTSFEGKSRNNAVAFTLGDRGFIATGVNGASAFYDDLFEFKPADEFNEDD